MSESAKMKELLDRLANAKHLRDAKSIDDGDLLGFAEETVDEYLELEAALASHDARSLGEARGYGKPTSCGSLQGHKGLGE